MKDRRVDIGMIIFKGRRRLSIQLASSCCVSQQVTVRITGIAPNPHGTKHAEMPQA